MKKLLAIIACFVMTSSFFVFGALADTSYTVVKGDSMWKIAVRYEVGLSEMIAANPQIKIPRLFIPVRY